MLIPILIVSVNGLYLPFVFVFPFETGLPVIIFTYLLAFTAGKIGVFYNSITKVEKIACIIAGIVFIFTGILE